MLLQRGLASGVLLGAMVVLFDFNEGLALLVGTLTSNRTQNQQEKYLEGKMGDLIHDLSLRPQTSVLGKDPIGKFNEEWLVG